MEQLTKQIYDQILEAMQLSLDLADPNKAKKAEARKKAREAQQLADLREHALGGNSANAGAATQHLNLAHATKDPRKAQAHRTAAEGYIKAAKSHADVVRAIDAGESLEKVKALGRAADSRGEKAFNAVPASIHNDAGEFGGAPDPEYAYKKHFDGEYGENVTHTVRPGYEEVHDVLHPENRPKLR